MKKQIELWQLALGERAELQYAGMSLYVTRMGDQDGLGNIPVALFTGGAYFNYDNFPIAGSTIVTITVPDPPSLEALFLGT